MFLFSPSHKQGILILTLLLVGIIELYRWNRPSQIPEKTVFASPLLENTKTPTKIYINQADSTEWETLPGIGQTLSSRIIKYRSSIGGFSDVTQLQKVYGLSPETYEAILPYLILDTIDIKKTQLDRTEEKYTEHPSKTYHTIDINTANAEDFAELSGIGEVLSERIIKFRTAKKGFKSVEELSQVYGLSKEVFEKNRPYFMINATTITSLSENTSPVITKTETENVPPAQPPTPSKYPTKNPQKTDINTATCEELQQIPGIGEKTAQKIIEARVKFGFFAKAEHMKSVVFIHDENYERMKPYLVVGNTATFTRKSLNKVQWKELISYPNMHKEIVTAIINSRKLGGYYQSWEDVAKVQGMNTETLDILKMYFELP